MSGSLARAAPVRFLIGVGLVWTMGRGLAVVGWSTPSPGSPAAAPTRSQRSPMKPPPLVASVMSSAPQTLPPSVFLRTAALDTRPFPSRIFERSAPPFSSSPDEGGRAGQILRLAGYAGGSPRIYGRPSGLAEAAVTAGQAANTRWSGSAWALLRGGGRATALSPGQIGGGQAGARILYRIDRHLSAAARISTAIGGARQTEAALGIDWKPMDGLPVHLMAERRIAIDRGGRNAWTLGAAGGVYDVRIAPGWRLDAYGEAGVVGVHQRDLYADGAARIARSIDMGGGTSLAIGGGLWGAAQPGASRLDVGPSAVLRLPVEHHSVAVALDWRERVLGHARPGSGLALTIATDF